MSEKGRRARSSVAKRIPNRALAIERCRALAEPIADSLNLELFDVQLLREGGYLILRFVIDNQTGITHTDCERFSRAIDPVLDEADPIESSYMLEVSSPGLERPLRKEADYSRFQGEAVELVYKTEVSGKETIRGIIGQLVDNTLTLLTTGKQERLLAMDSILEAHLIIDYDEGRPKRK